MSEIIRRGLLTALVATAVTARLPHPSTRTGEYVDRPRLASAAPARAPTPGDHGEPHRDTGQRMSGIRARLHV